MNWGFLLFISFAFSAVSFAGPRIIVAPISNLFVPTGFDDNDNTEIIVSGNFPSSCYKVGPSFATVEFSSKIIKLTVSAYKYEGICAQVLTPFLQSVRVGIVPSGDYQVIIDGSTLTDRAVISKSRTISPDDYLYAPVDNAKIEINALANQQILTIEGTFPYTFIGCAIMKDIKIIHNAPKILEVLPIMELVDDSRCLREVNQFIVKKELDHNLETNSLIHVRVLNGLSYNRMFVQE